LIKCCQEKHKSERFLISESLCSGIIKAIGAVLEF
jgi:hypothetical protein